MDWDLNNDEHMADYLYETIKYLLINKLV